MRTAIVGLLATLVLLAQVGGVEAQERVGGFRPDTLPAEALAERFVEHLLRPIGDPDRDPRVDAVVSRIMMTPDDERAPVVRDRVVRLMEGTDDWITFGRAASFVLRSAQAQPRWIQPTQELVMRQLQRPDDRIPSRLIRAVGSFGPLEIRQALVPVVTQMLLETNPRDLREQRRVLGHLVRLGEPGEEALDRLLAEGRLSDQLVAWIEFTRGGGGG